MEGNRIAVIGMSGRFPGASDLQSFWKNLSAGVESVRFFSDEELRAAGESEDALADPRYVRACARLDGIAMFDADFFGMTPQEASIFDPQHRIFLECAWEAFEHAGYVGEHAEGPVGVFGTCGLSEYMIKNVLTNPEVMAAVGEWSVRHTGNDAGFLATRVSYELNLRGPSLSVQTACSSSLVAIHLACQSLLCGECDLALAGGSTISAEQNKGYMWREGEIFSSDGHTRSFDAGSSGMTPSSATACVLLKRLAEAVRDGDHVLAVIRGSAVNNDGDDKVGFLAPSVSGQARAVAEALAMAGVRPDEISYVEAHGTGTRIGDSMEIAALTQAFQSSTKAKQYCAVGSVKSNIGHAGEAAGVVGFVKTVLALQHRQLPPSLHCESPNPECNFSSSPFYVNTSLRSWDGTPRVAGVTALGAGGTNCHVILEEAPPAPTPSPSGARARQLLVVSARSSAALEASSKNLAIRLADDPSLPLADVAFTLTVGRKAFRYRRAIVARDALDAVDAIASNDPRTVFSDHVPNERRRVALLFPGREALYAGMARELFEEEPVFRDAVEECLASTQPRQKCDLGALMFPGRVATERGGDSLEAPSLGLPAMFTIELAMSRLLSSWGVTPSALLGRGVGEYAAACVAGVLSLQDALALLTASARLLGALPPAGISAHPSTLEPVLGLCRAIVFAQPRIPLVSSLTGTWVTTAQATDARYWVECLCGAARFHEGLRALLDDGERTLVEVGPGSMLGSVAPGRPGHPSTIPTMRSSKEEVSDAGVLLSAVARLWTAGEADAGRLFAGQARRRVPLPTTPWQRQRYWIEPGKGATGRERSNGVNKGHDASGGHFASPSRRERSASYVAPRSPLERALGAIWQEVLGVDRVGAHDDFFELGGRSLVAVRLVDRIRKKYGVDLPLSMLFESPTLEACAEALSATLGSRETFRSLVAVQRGDGGTPFFYVHGAGGNVLNFRDLSRALGPTQPFYALQARGVDGILPPHDSVEEMAGAYLEEVRALQPRGPYMLGGYSGGGLVALEMARELTDAGEVVDLLALVDTFHPETPIRRLTVAMRLERLRHEGLGYVRDAARRQLVRRRARHALATADRLVARGEPIPPELREAYLMRNFERVSERYHPRSWSGRTILLRAADVEYVYGDAGLTYGWDRVIPQIEVACVPGNHSNLLLEPHATILISALRRAVEDARRQPVVAASSSRACQEVQAP